MNRKERNDRLMTNFKTIFSKHELRDSGPGWWLLQSRYEDDGSWKSDFAAKVVTGLTIDEPHQLTVFGDFHPVTFGFYGGSAQGILPWIGRCPDLEYYVAQKASIASGVAVAYEWDNTVAVNELAEHAANTCGCEHSAGDIEAIRRAMRPASKSRQDLESYLITNAPHLAEDLCGVGTVTAAGVYIAHAAIARLCDLLDQEVPAVTGYVATFNQPEVPFGDVIKPGAFARSLEERKPPTAVELKLEGREGLTQADITAAVELAKYESDSLPKSSISSDDALVSEQSEVPEAACLHTPNWNAAFWCSRCRRQIAVATLWCPRCDQEEEDPADLKKEIMQLEAQVADLKAEEIGANQTTCGVYDQIVAITGIQTGWDYPGQVVRCVEDALKTREDRISDLEAFKAASEPLTFSNERLVDAHMAGVKTGRAQILESTWDRPEFSVASTRDDFEYYEQGVSREDAIVEAIEAADDEDECLYVTTAQWVDPAKLMPSTGIIIQTMEENQDGFDGRDEQLLDPYITEEQRAELTQLLASWARRSVGQRMWEGVGRTEEIDIVWCDVCGECVEPVKYCRCEGGTVDFCGGGE